MTSANPGEALNHAFASAKAVLADLREKNYPNIRAYLDPGIYGVWTIGPDDLDVDEWIDFTDGRVCDAYRLKVARAAANLVEAMPSGKK